MRASKLDSVSVEDEKRLAVEGLKTVDDLADASAKAIESAKGVGRARAAQIRAEARLAAANPGSWKFAGVLRKALEASSDAAPADTKKETRQPKVVEEAEPDIEAVAVTEDATETEPPVGNGSAEDGKGQEQDRDWFAPPSSARAPYAEQAWAEFVSLVEYGTFDAELSCKGASFALRLGYLNRYNAEWFHCEDVVAPGPLVRSLAPGEAF
ncbi:MAG: helix-hairpin-helix domain-containing protein, partial [Planctomycetota bacterium]